MATLGLIDQKDCLALNFNPGGSEDYGLNNRGHSGQVGLTSRVACSLRDRRNRGLRNRPEKPCSMFRLLYDNKKG